MVLFFMSLNGFFLKEFLLQPESNDLMPINKLSIVSAFGHKTSLPEPLLSLIHI